MQSVPITTLRVQIPLRRGVLDATLCDKIWQLLAAGRWFSPVSSNNKTDRHDIINWSILESGIKHHNPNPTSCFNQAWSLTGFIYIYNVPLKQYYLGGVDGAITEAKYSWFCRFPLITSDTVLIVWNKITFIILTKKYDSQKSVFHIHVPSLTRTSVGFISFNRFNTVTLLCLSQARTWISNFICCGLFLCSMIWGERWLFALLILVELLVFTV